MPALDPAQHEEVLGHPKGLFVCFATELWERFSFYGMKFLLLLYLTKYHLFSDHDAFDVLGSYAGLVYALPVIGGILADAYLGMRKAVVFGAVLLCLGHGAMAYEGFQAVEYAAGTTLPETLTLPSGEILAAGTTLQETVIIRDDAALDVFYFALALIIAGVAYLKANISAIVGQLYVKNDPRRDRGFTIYYMGINLGSLLATLICGWLGETYGWGYGFGAAGIGMVLGLFTFLSGQKHFHGVSDPPDPAKLRERVLGIVTKEVFIYAVSIVSLYGIWHLVRHEPVVYLMQNVLLWLSVAGLLAYSFLKGNTEDRYRMGVLTVLILSSVVFWALFEQSAGSMTLFADRGVDRILAGAEVRASQLGSLNPIFIVLLAPVFAWFWGWLGKRSLEPSTPVKFSLGIVLAGLGFGALVVGISAAQSSDTKTGLVWLVLAYLLHTMGEICVSPVGLSAVTKLSITRVVGFAMGTWFLATSLSETVATRLGKIAAIDTGAAETADLASSLAVYSELFLFLTYVGVGTGLFLLLLSPLLKRGMRGVV